MEIASPTARPGRPFIAAYGNGGFRIGDQAHAGSILVLPDRALAWAAPEFAALAESDLAPVIAAGGAVELLLLGCGARMLPPSPALRAALRRHAIALEAVDTGAACRTFNLLLAEDRRVAAALYAV